MNCLTPHEIIQELLCWYSNGDLSRQLGVARSTINGWKLETHHPRDLEELKLREIFELHVATHSHLVDIATLESSNGATLLVDTPDGFQTIKRFVKKGIRSCLTLSTKDQTLTASKNHLIEADFGWTHLDKIVKGDLIVTKTGLKDILAIVKAPDARVYDVEVEHPNHRLWTEGISSHNTGKSFLLSNIFVAAQADGAFILAIDSENALDHDYLQRIGVDVSEDKFLGVAVVTISDIVSVVSDFIMGYEKEYGKYNDNAPKVLIAIDSLDMLLTDTENDHFSKGVQKGDQGQRAKQMKAFLRTTVSRIKALNIAFIGTHQVYPADVMQGEGKWAINNAIRYSASQIVLITKLKLKEGEDVVGIKMKVETFKSRFAKLGSKVEILVPYDKGMNPYSGLLELLEKDGVCNKKPGAQYWTASFPGEPDFRFKEGELTPVILDKLLSHPLIKEQANRFDEVVLTPEMVEVAEEEGPETVVV